MSYKDNKDKLKSVYKSAAKIILRSKLVIAAGVVSLAFVIWGWLSARATLAGISGTPLILHFNDLVGINSVGSFRIFDFMGIFGIIIVAVNFFISMELDTRGRFLGRFFSILTLIFAFLLFLAFTSIIGVNQ